MRTPRRLLVLALSALLASTAGTAAVASQDPARPHAEPVLLAKNLAGGAGSTIGPDGALYVTEPEAGEVTRIDRRTGETSTFASGLPVRPEDTPGGAVDVAFLGPVAYVLVTVVEPAAASGLYRIDAAGKPHLVADIGAWSASHPPAAEVAVPTGVQYALQPYRGGFLVTDGHHNRVLRVRPGGFVAELVALDNVVPTGLDTVGRTVLIAEAGPVPHRPEDGRIVAFVPGKHGVTEIASGGRLLVDVEATDHGLYALAQGEFTPGNAEGSPADPGTGQIMQATSDGDLLPVVRWLDRPTSFEIVGKVAYVVTLDGEVWRVDLRTRH